MVKVFRAYRGLTESEQRGAGHRGDRCEGAHIRLNSHLCQCLQERA